MTRYLFILLGAALLAIYLSVRLKGKRRPLVERIDALLPQTQCGQCGYPGCEPYAQAIARGEADINQCPPGGAAGIRALAQLLGREFKPLSALHGVEKPKAVAVIDESLCIGCTLCIQACPVDAIVGAAKQMHTVVPPLCTGCELCLPPCPVDCIAMIPVEAANRAGGRSDRKAADAARERYRRRNSRLERERREKAARLAARTEASSEPSAADQKRALIAAAIARAQQQKAQIKPHNIDNLTPEQRAEIAAIEARRSRSPDAAGTPQDEP